MKNVLVVRCVKAHLALGCRFTTVEYVVVGFVDPAQHDRDRCRSEDLIGPVGFVTRALRKLQRSQSSRLAPQPIPLDDERMRFHSLTSLYSC